MTRECLQHAELARYVPPLIEIIYVNARLEISNSGLKCYAKSVA